MAHEHYKVAKQIEAEWFLGAENKFGTKYDKYHLLRKYARGEHDVEESKSLITNGAERSHTNYDFSPIQVLPKFKDRLVNDMFPQLYNLEANAVDKYSTDLRNKEKERLMDRLVSKSLDEDMKSLFDIDMEAGTSGDRPNSEEEVEMRMQMEFKPNVEISAEESLKYTFRLNNYKETLTELLNDAVDLGRVGAWVSMHPTKGIVIQRMDPAEAVWSYSIKRDHSDVWYYGVRKRITVGELMSMTGELYDINEGKTEILSEDFAKKIRGSIQETFRNKGQSTRNNTSEFDLSEKIDILYYTHKTTKKSYLKRKEYKSGVIKISEFKGEYDGKETKGFTVIPKVDEVWYDGHIILGSPYGFGHQLVGNLAYKKKGGIRKVFPPAMMYANSLYEGTAKGMIERAVTIINKMQTVEIKIQQLVAAAKPSGIRIDVSKIGNITTPGGVMDYQTVMKIYNETGNEVYHSGNGDHGEFSQGNIHELRNGVVSGINDLVNIQNNYLNQLRDALGLPQGVDASSPHPDTAVKIQEQITRSSNISVSHVLDSVLKLTSSIADSSFERIKDILKYHPSVRESYVKAIGKVNVDIIGELDDLILADIGIFVSLKPDAPSKLRLEENIAASLTTQAITLDDAQECRDVGESNTKLATQLLRTRRIKKEKDLVDRENQKIELQGQQQIKLTETQAAVKEEQLQIALTIDQSRIQSEAEADIAVARENHRLKMEELGVTFNYEMQLKQAVTQVIDETTRFKEGEKQKRQDKNNTETSKVTEQRLNNGPAQDFTQRQA